MRMLAASWSSAEPGTIPLPLSLGAKVVGLPPRLVLAFLGRNPGTFREVAGRLVNDKLYGQWLEYKDLSEKRSAAARSKHDANAQQVHVQKGGSASASASANSNTKTSATPAAMPPLPVWIPEPTWFAFSEMRRKMRAPLMPSSALLILKKLRGWMDEGQSPQDVLEQSIVNGWRGVFPIKKEEIKNGRGPLSAREAVRRSIENLRAIG